MSKAGKKYFPQFLFLISFRLSLTEGGIWVRLEDGSIMEASSLSVDWCMDTWRPPVPRSSSPLLVLSKSSGLNHYSTLAIEMTVLKGLFMSSFCGSTSAARRVWLETFSCKLRVAQSSQRKAVMVSSFISPTSISHTSVSSVIIFLFPTVVLTLLFPG